MTPSEDDDSGDDPDVATPDTDSTGSDSDPDVGTGQLAADTPRRSGRSRQPPGEWWKAAVAASSSRRAADLQKTSTMSKTPGQPT